MLIRLYRLEAFSEGFRADQVIFGQNRDELIIIPTHYWLLIDHPKNVFHRRHGCGGQENMIDQVRIKFRIQLQREFLPGWTIK